MKINQYGVCVEGENFLIERDGKPPRKYGFYVWRCVEAETQSEAEAIALHRALDGIAISVRNADDAPPVLRVEEVREGYGDLEPPGSGYIFFPMEEDDAPKGFFSRMRERFRRVSYRNW